MSLSSKSSTGPDKISNKVLKMILPHIITDLTSCKFARIKIQLERQEIIDPNQFGFRKGHSTVHPLMITKDFIENELNKRNYVCLIALDLKKAFDCIKTDGSLQNKVNYYCQNKQITNWIDSYFKDRQQITSWGSSNSNKIKNHRISVIQGSKQIYLTYM